jgi:GNAT superfamily N-acetyltransferase
MSEGMRDDMRVVRARLEEVQPLAREYAQDGATEGTAVEPPLPKGGIFWIARDGEGEPMGYAAGQLRPGEGLVLGPVFVRPEHRRGGVALRLLREIEGWADGARIPVVEVSVATDNDAGVRFLEAAGYEPRRLLMARGGTDR